MARRWGETSPVEEVVFIYTTWPDAETADAAALEAVERGLAACANRFAPVRATYRWEGRIETGEETPLTFKTTAARAPALKALILERHPGLKRKTQTESVGGKAMRATVIRGLLGPDAGDGAPF